jgi:CRISPR/Cas system-associated exonuclease Cas4 (RecB family)
MKTMLLLVLLSVAGTLVWGYIDRLRGGKSSGFDDVEVATRLPGMLAKATIWGKEMTVACRSPRRMHGCFDEAFKLENGEIVVSETKSRERIVVHESDVIQLSAYAVAVAEGGKHKVNSKGFIRVVTPSRNEYVQVDLLSIAEVERAYDKFKYLASGRETGEKCGKPALCRSCLYKKECDSMH